MTNELKPCPFCGGDAHFNEHTNKHSNAKYIVVRCELCESQTKPFYFGDDGEDLAYKKAASTWNRRYHSYEE